ncbi:MAG: hypothetical protein AB4426_03340 [Xenococcaceae cyanobacterium]
MAIRKRWRSGKTAIGKDGDRERRRSGKTAIGKDSDRERRRSGKTAIGEEAHFGDRERGQGSFDIANRKSNYRSSSLGDRHRG